MRADTPTAARPRHDGVSTVALLAALAASLIPLPTVVSAGAWTGLSTVLAAVLLAAGYLARRLRLPALLVTLIEGLLWTAIMTAVFFSDVAILGVIPTGEALDRVPRLIETAAGDITTGVAPLTASPSLTFLIVGAVGLLVVALDHVVLTARMPLLAGIALVTVWLIPTLAVPREVDVWAFALLALALLWLMRTETRSRARARSRTPAAGGVGVVSAAIATAAIVVAVVAAPTLPAPAASGGGFGGGTAIDATLNLGDDLRRPSEAPVLRQRTDGGSPPYLRVATLTGLDGDAWRPDRPRSVPLGEWEPGDPEVAPDIEVTETRTSVRVLDLASAQLPVPYPAVSVTGVSGDWRVALEGRTLTSPSTPARGQEYEVVTRTPQPTLEQARAAASGGATTEARSLPADTPDEIGRIARQVTAGAETDYDRLVALQTWFRGADFTYSLDAPVEDGFDGSGVEAISRFLDVRSGYCVHYASAFALMARTLDMPSRIVVGFLPGTATGEVEDDERVYQATTAQLHSWPEVHFEGLGWVAFEPTKSLGTPQRYASGEDDSAGPGAEQDPTPTAQPSTSASAAPRPDEDVTAGGAAAGSAPVVDLAPVLGTLGAACLLFGAPAAIRAARMLILRRRAAGGAVTAAWRMAQDAATDLGIPVPGSESPRAFGDRLIERHGAPPAAVQRLVSAVEIASYAAPDARRGSGESLADDAAAVRAGLLAAVSPRDRLMARLFPRSLVVRPGSTFAELRPVRI